MYDKDKLKEIIEELVEGTEQGFIKWSEDAWSANQDTKYHMYYTSDDGDTRFELRIDLNNDLTIDMQWSQFLWIKNDDLVDDKLHLSGSNYPKIKDLTTLIYDINIKPTLASKRAKKGVLDDILGGINKQARRDRRIGDVLEGTEEKKPKRSNTFRKKRRGKWGLF